MRRGTTPPVIVDIDTDLRNAREIWFTLADTRGGELTVEKADMTVEEGRLRFTLTQEQTLSLRSGKLRAQVRALMEDGSAIASDEVPCQLRDILKEGEIVEI